jgi:hypothetical protein
MADIVLIEHYFDGAWLLIKNISYCIFTVQLILIYYSLYNKRKLTNSLYFWLYLKLAYNFKEEDVGPFKILISKQDSMQRRK